MAQKIPREPLLELSTFVDRQFILIDEQKFEIKNRGEMGLLELAAFARVSAEAQRIAAKTEHTIEDLQELDSLSAQAVRKILVDVPDEVMSKLTLDARSQILAVFTQLLSGQATDGSASMANPTNGKTGAK